MIIITNTVSCINWQISQNILKVTGLGIDNTLLRYMSIASYRTLNGAINKPWVNTLREQETEVTEGGREGGERSREGRERGRDEGRGRHN